MAIKTLGDYVKENNIDMNRKYTTQELQDITWTNKQKKNLTRYQPKKKEKKGNFITRTIATVDDAFVNMSKGFLDTTEGIADTFSYLIADVEDFFGADEMAERTREQTKRNLIDELYGNSKTVKAIKNEAYQNKYVTSIEEGIGNVAAMAGGAKALSWANMGGTTSTVTTSFTSAYGNATSEALRNGASLSDARKAGLINGTSEALSEQFFDALPGMKVEGWGSKVIGKIGSGVERYFGTNTGKLVMKALNASGEGFEEIISNMLTSAGNDIMHHFDKNYTYGMENQSGNILKDVWRAATSKESWDSFISAALTSAITNGGNTLVSNTQKNNIIKSYAKENNMSVKQVKDMFNQTVQERTEYQKQQQPKMNLGEQVELEQQNKIRTLEELQKGTYVQPGTETQKYQYKETDNQKLNEMNKSLAEVANNTQLTRETAKTAERLVKDLGFNIKFTNNEQIQNQIKNGEIKAVDGANINGYVKNGTMYINVDSDQLANFTIGHETKHFFEANEELNNALNQSLKEYAQQKGVWDKMLAERTDLYTDKDGNLVGDPEGELLADLSGQFFTDYNFVSNLSTKNPSLFQKTKDFFQKLYYKATGQQEKLLLKQINENFNKVYREYAKNKPDTNISSNEIQKVSQKEETKQEIKKKVKPKEETVLPIAEKAEEKQETVKKQEKKVEIKEKSQVKQENRLTKEEQEELDGLQAAEEAFGNEGQDKVRYDYLMDKKNGNLKYPSLKSETTYQDIKNKYTKYKNNMEGFNSDLIQQAKDFVPGYRNTERRTKQQWLDVAEMIGKRSNFKNDAELEKYAIQSWFKEQPNQKDNLNRQGEKFVKFTIEDWINSVYKGAGVGERIDNSIKYSLSETGSTQDDEGRKLSKAQVEFFKDSKATDGEGNLITVYHGSRKAGFYNFNRNFNYYTDNKNVSQSYAGSDEMVDTKKLESIPDAKSWLKGISEDLYIENNTVYGYDGEEIVKYNNPEELLRKLKRDIQIQVGDEKAGGNYEGYVNIEKPLIVDVNGDYWSGIKVDGIGLDNAEEILKKYGSSTFMEKGALRTSTDDISSAISEAVENGELDYDGIIFKNIIDEGLFYNTKQGTDLTHGTVANDYITFNSNQFKAADNTTPTTDSDIRYSLSKDNKGRKLSEQQQEFFKDSKARDENGDLLTLYHGTYNDDMFTVFDPEKGFNVDAIYLTPDISVSSEFGNGSSIRNFDKTLVTRINNAKTVDDLINIFKNDLNTEYKIEKVGEDNYWLNKNDGLLNSPLGTKISDNVYSRKTFNGEVKETNLFEKLKSEALETAQETQIYGSNYELYANITNPLVVDAKGNSYHQIDFEGKTYNTETISSIAKERGYDGVIVKNVLETPYENKLTDDYIVFNSNQVKYVKNLNPTENADIRYSLSKDAIRDIAKELDESPSMLEANLGDTEYDVKRYLTKYTKLVDKYMKDNNIEVEPVYKSTELDKIPQELKQFIIDNDITVEKLGKNKQLLNEYLELQRKDMIDKGISENIVKGVIKQLNESYDLVDDNGKSLIPFSLKRENKQFDLIKNNTTEIIDNIETDRKIQKEVVESPKFQKYLDKLIKPLFYKESHTVEEVMEEAKDNHGVTNNWDTGAYMTTDGELLNFNDNGYRDDHRTISVFDLDMNEFMDYGAIRMKPEGNGFEMAVEPTNEQYSKLEDYIDNYLKQKGDESIFVDFDIPGTKNYDSAVYNVNTPTSKIINDIQTYYKTGKLPQKSQYADFYYSLSREGQNISEELDEFYTPKNKVTTRLSDLKRKEVELPITEEKPLKLSKNEQKQANEIKEEYLPLAKNNDVLRVDAENIAKEINKTGDFDTTKQRKWIQSLKNSDAIQDKSILKDLDMSKLSYEVQTNQKSLDRANDYIENNGYENSLNHVKDLIRSEKTPTATDVALLQRMTQEAIKNKDYQTAQELIMDTAILGTDLGQAVQAMSIIQKLTPEGQLKLYTKMINRAKIRGEKAFTDVEITPDMVETLLGAYNEDGTYDQNDLTSRVEKFKQDVATQMKSTIGDKVNAWRYLSMLGNPKTHIRNVVSNVAMKGTIKVKNALARTLETVLPIKERTKTFERASKEIKNYAKETAAEMKGIITGENKYNEKVALEQEKQIFKNKALEGISRFNSAALEAEDWFFSRSAFESNLSEYLTANGIKSMEDIKNNPEIVEKAKIYAVEQAEIATFRQYSKLAAEINRIERNGKLSKYAINAVLPFKKTPINVAKAGFNYSPLGLIKNISYDAYQLKQGNINGSQFIDNISQGLTGTSVALLGYALAKAGILSGGGDDDKEGKYDSQLGKQSYALNIGGKTYSISWLSPTGMPLLVGANLYEKLEEDKDWSFDVVADTLANTLDPMSEMSFLSSLTDVLKSYNTGGTQMIKSMTEAGTQSYILQFFPTLFGQLASTLDDTKRSTKASNNSNWKFGEETIRKIMLKVPGLRNQLEEQTDIWGNAKQQTNNIITRAVESFIAPYSKTEDITSDIDKEIKRVFNQTGETSVIPGIPQAYVKKDDETFKMSASEYTKYKQTFGQTANRTMNELFNSSSYKEVDDTEKAKMIENVYKYAREQAKQEYFNSIKEDYNAKETSKVDKIQDTYGITAGDYYANKDEYSYAEKNPGKYLAITQVADYKDYNEYKSEISRIKQEYDNTNDRKNAVFEYINSLPLNVEQKLILQKTAANYSIKQYRGRLQDYIESLDLSVDEKQAIDKVLFD